MPPKSSKKITKGTHAAKPKAGKPKKTVEKLSDITDEVEEDVVEEEDAVDDESKDVEENGDEEDLAEEDPAESDIPALEAVSTALKEKYEYKPMQQVRTVYVRPKDRITSEVMTKFEYAESVSIRAKQLEDGDQPFTDVGDLSDPIEMAKKEIADKKCPLSVVRNRTTEGDTTIAELWQVNEMAIPYD
jgi:DNA-directed RNA polymerase I, II, and III subunit RPABC2